MLVAHKLGVHRDVVFERVRELSGIDMRSIAREVDLPSVIEALEALRFRGVDDA